MADGADSELQTAVSFSGKLMTTSRIKGLGEIALRVRELDAMQRFYEQVMGLEVLKRLDNAVFFKLADGFGGHTQVLVLFDRSAGPGYSGLNVATSTIDHIAFEIERADFDTELKRLQGSGLAVTTAEHAWVHWRSLYVDDPEGNSVELVCYDPTVR
jgi:catechol 2,3-dioxygenase